VQTTSRAPSPIRAARASGPAPVPDAVPEPARAAPATTRGATAPVVMVVGWDQPLDHAWRALVRSEHVVREFGRVEAAGGLDVESDRGVRGDRDADPVPGVGDRVLEVAADQPRLAVGRHADHIRIVDWRRSRRKSQRHARSDAARVPALIRRIVEGGADYAGLHIFAGSQALDADALIEAQRATVALAAEHAVNTGDPQVVVSRHHAMRLAVVQALPVPAEERTLTLMENRKEGSA